MLLNSIIPRVSDAGDFARTSALKSHVRRADVVALAGECPGDLFFVRDGVMVVGCYLAAVARVPPPNARAVVGFMHRVCRRVRALQSRRGAGRRFCVVAADGFFG